MMMKKIKRDAVFRGLVLTALITTGIIYYPYLKTDKLIIFIRKYSTIAPIIFITICALRPIIFYLPSAGLTIIAGMLFGLYHGTLYVCLGGALSTITGYFFARWMGRGIVKKMVMQNAFLSKIERFSRHKGWKLVLYLRLFNLPWDIVSYWSALSGIPFREFYFSSILVIIPISFIYTLLGSNITRPLSKEFIFSLVVIIGLGALPFLWSRFQRENETEDWSNKPSGKQDTY